MDEEMALTLQDELIADLTVELSVEPTFNEAQLKQKVIGAIREIKTVRKYPSYYTEAQITADLYNFYANARNIALYDYNKIGAEFQKSSSENGTSRSYDDRNSLFSGVIPLCRV